MMHSAPTSYNILTCRDNFENNEAEVCILTRFETYEKQNVLSDIEEK